MQGMFLKPLLCLWLCVYWHACLSLSSLSPIKYLLIITCNVPTQTASTQRCLTVCPLKKIKSVRDRFALDGYETVKLIRKWLNLALCMCVCAHVCEGWLCVSPGLISGVKPVQTAGRQWIPDHSILNTSSFYELVHAMLTCFSHFMISSWIIVISSFQLSLSKRQRYRCLCLIRISIT